MLRRIDHVGVVVADLEWHMRQLEWMGLELGRSNDSDQSLARYYPCGDASVELIEARTAGSKAQRLGAVAARIEHIAFEVDDLAEVRDRLTERGVTVTWPPFRSGPNLMIWTDEKTSGGVQYQFLVRSAPGRSFG
jgi:catechol 2,3-dioxygenase-like lactoylglutathione lyase family enzyme